MIDKDVRERRRREQAEGAKRLVDSGALDDLFAQIDAGEVRLDGRDGLIQQLIKTGLERGLRAELTDHVGYELGDPEAPPHDNSRNVSFPKTVSTVAGDVDLDLPRDRNGTLVPRLVPTGQRHLGGLDEMIVSLYAGGMTVRYIEHYLASTISASGFSKPRVRSSGPQSARSSPTVVSATCSSSAATALEGFPRRSTRPSLNRS